jgi:chaperonin GroES
MEEKLCPITPLGDRVVIQEREEGDQTYGNIVIPDMGNEKPIMGTVLAVGEGRTSPEGKLIPNKVEKGSIVLIPVFGAQKITLDGEEYIIAESTSILGTVNL